MGEQGIGLAHHEGGSAATEIWLIDRPVYRRGSSLDILVTAVGGGGEHRGEVVLYLLHAAASKDGYDGAAVIKTIGTAEV